MQEGPDLHAPIGKVCAAEGLAAIATSINAIGGANENEIGIPRVDEDGECFDLAQRVFPVGVVDGAAKHTGEATLLAGIVTADAGEHVGWNHGTFFPSKILRHDILLRVARQCDGSSL